MTLEELWQLFPIVLTEHQDVWADWFREEAGTLRELLGERACRISHIGSTAVPGIWAKPIVDILLEVEDRETLLSLPSLLSQAGYRPMSRAETRISFNKGYTPEGFAERVFHLHARLTGDRDELYFRDYLRANPDAAKEYERLKLSLWKPFEHDRDGYTEAKSAFVRDCTRLAKSGLSDCGSVPTQI